jgi:2-polyprenyl-3-methyl-5-hydroxy-6-metoxy-1,4-benzoquinol methylase
VITDTSNEKQKNQVTPSKTERVKAVFEEPDWYLSRRRYNIRIRTETVQEIVQGKEFHHILDIACGDGSISIPLLRAQNRLTLLDISSSMLAHARSHIPAELLPNVEMLNREFLSAELQPQGYDLIICLGLLAHVDNPVEVIAKIKSLLRPGGMIIMESTDSGHPLNSIARFMNRLSQLWRPIHYPVNLITSDDVIRMFAQHQLCLVSIFRYSLAFFPRGSQEGLYNSVRATFGSFTKNSNAWLGKECIYVFRPD